MLVTYEELLDMAIHAPKSREVKYGKAFIRDYLRRNRMLGNQIRGSETSPWKVYQDIVNTMTVAEDFRPKLFEELRLAWQFSAIYRHKIFYVHVKVRRPRDFTIPDRLLKQTYTTTGGTTVMFEVKYELFQNILFSKVKYAC